MVPRYGNGALSCIEPGRHGYNTTAVPLLSLRLISKIYLKYDHLQIYIAPLIYFHLSTKIYAVSA